MDKAVAQRPRHREVHAALGGRIAGCDHHPAVRETIFAKLAIEDQLVAACLRHLRRGGQLVQKEDALPARGQELRRHPLGLVGSDSRQASQIDRIELDGANIEKLPVQIRSNLGDDLRFADAAGAPDVQRHTFADQRMQRFKECEGFIGLSFRNEEDGWNLQMGSGYGRGD